MQFQELKLSTVESLIAASKKQEEDFRAKHPDPLIRVSDLEPYDPERDPKFEILSGLSNTAKAELTALYWFGRGTADSVQDGLDQVNRFPNDDRTDYLEGKRLHTELTKALQDLSGVAFASEL